MIPVKAGAAVAVLLGLDAAGLASAVNWSSTITLGSMLVGVIVGLAGLAFVGFGAKWKAAAEAEREVAASYRDGREAFRIRNERLAADNKECQEKIRELLYEIGEQKGTIAELEARPNLAMVDAGVRILGAKLDQHEEHAEQRAERLVGAVESLPDAIGNAVQKSVDGLLEQQQKMWPPEKYDQRGDDEQGG